MKRSAYLSLSMFLLLMARSASADPVQWTGNGHWYQVFSQGVGSWEQGIAAAEASTWLGEQGYLVSITSQAELDFLVSQFGSTTQYMIGLTDKDQEGTWTWQSGEPFVFSFWASGEPNNHNNEDYVCMNWQHANQPQPNQPPGAWNDLPNFHSPFIVEYNPVPEPASLLLLGTGLAGLARWRRRRT